MRIHALKPLAMVVLACTSSLAVAADQREELLEIKHTILNLVDQLVTNKIITAAQAEKMKQEAQDKARGQAATEAKEQIASNTETAPLPEDSATKKVVRVPYVPEFVKEDIRNQVKAELRKEVHDDVVATAKAEQWGTAKALPEWVNTFKWYGDIRLRHQGDFFDAENRANSYANFAAINRAGNITGADTFLNVTEDRQRERMQMRFGFEARPFDSLRIGARLVTGNETDPTSLNQTLGQNFGRYRVALDQGYLRWAFSDDQSNEYLVLNGGRIQRPFFSTNLVWDEDVSFEGVAVSVIHSVSTDDSLFGDQFPNNTFNLTLGVFPLAENELAVDDNSSNDKWLLGAQLSFLHSFENQNSVHFGAAVYDYLDIVGKFNPDGAIGNTVFDWTAPAVLQKGNSLYPIKFDAAGNPSLFGLAANYTLVNLTGEAIFSYFAPIQVVLTGDYVKNIGFDKRTVLRRTGTSVSDRSSGFHIALDVGWSKMNKFGDWDVFAAYKFLERDAVLDAYTDSDFHLGGTDAKGWIIGGKYGLARNTWLQLRYLSSDSIDGPPLGIDTLQVDLNAKF